MKKVLALVLAVVMVCTMAFAATVVITPGTAITDPTDPAATYTALKPGTTIALDLGTVGVYVKDGKFVPANNVVTVTFAKGAELVKSQGWVKVAAGTEGSYKGEKDTDAYQYQITFVENLNKAADTKVAEISISGVSFKATGYTAVSVFKATKASENINYAFGYATNDIDLQAKVAPSVIGGEINVVKSLADENGKEVATLEVTANNGVVYTMVKGTKFYAMETPITFDAKDKGYDGTSIKALYPNTWNLNGKVELALGADANKTFKVYAKTADGKVLSVAATTNDGVMSFTVPAMSTVLVTENTITTSGTTGTTTGTTTNPGTGANDVVGVAAALAVVALVSGAAISLKK